MSCVSALLVPDQTFPEFAYIVDAMTSENKEIVPCHQEPRALSWQFTFLSEESSLFMNVYCHGWHTLVSSKREFKILHAFQDNPKF